MKKALLIIALLVGTLGYGQALSQYQRLLKRSTADVNSIDTTRTDLVYTAIDSTLGIEVINWMDGNGWVPRITGGGGSFATLTGNARDNDDLDAELDLKADDDEVLKLTSNQTSTGIKSFQSIQIGGTTSGYWDYHFNSDGLSDKLGLGYNDTDGYSGSNLQYTFQKDGALTLDSDVVKKEDLDAKVGLTNGDKGDVVLSGTGSTVWTIDNGVINTAKLASGAVTNIIIANGTIGKEKLKGINSPTDGQMLVWRSIGDVFEFQDVPSGGGGDATTLGGRSSVQYMWDNGGVGGAYNWNTGPTANGTYLSNDPSDDINAPFSTSSNSTLLNLKGGTQIAQLAVDGTPGNNRWWVRSSGNSGSTFSDWKEIGVGLEGATASDIGIIDANGNTSETDVEGAINELYEITATTAVGETTLTATKTGVLTDKNGIITNSTSSDFTYTINSGVFEVGEMLNFENFGTGEIVIAYGAGVTGDVAQTININGTLQLWQRTLNDWVIRKGEAVLTQAEYSALDAELKANARFNFLFTD